MLNKIWNRVERWLALRPHSEWEIEMYLSRRVKKWEQKYRIKNLHDQLFKLIETHGFINDDRFAKWWAEQRVEFKRFGSIRIKSELEQKQVSREIIDEVVSKIVHPEEKKLAKEWVNAVKLKQPDWKRDKIVRFLTSKGFSYSLVNDLIQIRD